MNFLITNFLNFFCVQVFCVVIVLKVQGSVPSWIAVSAAAMPTVFLWLSWRWSTLESFFSC